MSNKEQLLNRLYLENRTNLSLFISSLIYSKNNNDIEDCLQETFLIVIKKAKSGDIDGHPNVKGWLFSIAKNVSKKFNTAYAKNKISAVRGDDAEFTANEADFARQVLEDMLYDEVDKVKLVSDIINEMTASEREIFELKRKNFSNREIAAMLNKSESTVKSTYSRLRPKVMKKIRDLL